MMRSLLAGLAAVGFSSIALAGSATYQFNNTLSSNEAGNPDLVSVDPLSANGFETDTVFGISRQVFRWDGNDSPINQQAGLLLDTSSIITDPNNYTLELVFKFTEDTNTWRSIFNTNGRLADEAFYVEPFDRLQVYNDVTGTSNFVTDEYHYIVMTVGNNTVLAYFDGVLELSSPTDKLNITDPTVAFFLDNNLGGPAQSEFADGKVSLIRIADGVLSAPEILDRADDPFTPVVVPNPGPNPIPIPSALLIGLPGLALAGVLKRRLGL